MNILQPLTREQAPDASRDVMNSLENEMGFLPNLYRVLAHSPSALRAYAALNKLVHDTSLSLEEQQAVLLAISRENHCEYSMAAQSYAARGAGLDEAELDALRESRPVPNNARLEALRRLAQRVVVRRGQLNDEDIDAFLAAGFNERQVLEVILAVAMKTLSDYASHVARPPVDERYAEMSWEMRQQERRELTSAGRRRADRIVPSRGSRYSH
jgi:uncharacterized peroxidase-related enzyme